MGYPVTAEAAAFTPDGRRIITADSDYLIRTWGLDGKELRAFKPDNTRALALSAGAGRLLSASGAQRWGAGIRFMLWDTTGGKEVLTIKD